LFQVRALSVSNRQEKERRRQARVAGAQASAQRAARRRERRLFVSTMVGVAAIAAIVVVVVSGPGHSSNAAAPQLVPAPHPSVPAVPAAAGRGVPPQIAANAADANRVVDGSVRVKLSALRGVPVVVNQWASWCPNCKQEFPFFQQLARAYGKQVAFVGLDSQDNRGDAQSFLARYPVSYPSIYDPSADETRSIGGGQAWPTTFFYDHTGRQVFARVGGYPTAALLQADIQRYALGTQQ
jgi:thiol-disulfide isomerase/thioredoxin